MSTPNNVNEGHNNNTNNNNDEKNNINVVVTRRKVSRSRQIDCKFNVQVAKKPGWRAE